MIVYRLKELAESKGWDKSKVHYDSGISYPTVLKVWNNKIKQIDITVLERLCELFDCDPGDLIKRIPNETTTTGTP